MHTAINRHSKDMHTISTQNHYQLTCSHVAKIVSTTLFAYQRANLEDHFLKQSTAIATHSLGPMGEIDSS